MTEQPRMSVGHYHSIAIDANSPNHLAIILTADELYLIQKNILKDADNSQSEAFLRFNVSFYKCKGRCNGTLSQYCADCFKSFSEDHFA